jgi:hypothetical protein
MTSIITDVPSPSAHLNRSDGASVMVTKRNVDRNRVQGAEGGRRADVTRVMTRTGERPQRAKAACEIRPDVDTAVLVSMMPGSVLQMAVTSGRRGADDAWVTAMVSVLLDGIRPPVRSEGEKGPVAP